jgi:hypothetical protein
MEITEQLIRRVERLERQSKFIKIVNAIVLAAFVAMAEFPIPSALSKPAPGPVNATQVNLFSTNGSLLARLGNSANGGVLTFFDQGGNKTVQVGMGPTSSMAGLTVFDGNALNGGTGKLRGQWGISSQNGAAEIFADQNGQGRAILSTTGGDGGDAMNFYDTAGKQTAFVGESADGTGAGLVVFDGNNLAPGQHIARAGFGVGTVSAQLGGGFGEGIVDSKGVPRYTDGIQFDESAPGAFAYDVNGKLRVGMYSGSTNNFAGVFTNDASGTTRSTFGQSVDGSFSFSALRDSTGTLQVNAYSSGDGTISGLNVSDAAGNLREFLNQTPSGVGLGIFDGSIGITNGGTLVFHAP